jgi:hypothetical protein
MSHPPEATWKSVPSSHDVVEESTMNGKKISDEKKVLSNNTGMTAFPESDFFLKES